MTALALLESKKERDARFVYPTLGEGIPFGDWQLNGLSPGPYPFRLDC